MKRKIRLEWWALVCFGLSGCEQHYIPTFNDAEISCTATDGRESWRFSVWLTDADGPETISQVTVSVQDLSGEEIYASALELDADDVEHWSLLRAASEVGVDCASGYLYLYRFRALDATGESATYDVTYP